MADALLPDGSRVDVKVVDGLVATVGPVGVSEDVPEAFGAQPSSASLKSSSLKRYELNGMLLLPALAEPHAHLDKALTAGRIANPTGDLMGAIEAWVHRKSGIAIEDAIEDTIERSCRALEIAMASGVTALRTHLDVGSDIGARSVEALAEVRRRYEHCLDLQIAALVSIPLTGPEGRENRQALSEALEAGADLVGGAPAIDPRPSECVAECLSAASDAEVGLDLHIDETLDPSVCTLATLAKLAIDREFPHAVTASHCVSLGSMPVDVQRSVAALVAEAEIDVVTLPLTNLFLQGREHPVSTPRGFTAFGALAEAGVRVAAGGDNVQDPFNPVGRGDPLEVASLMVTGGHQRPETAFEFVSSRARALMRLPSASPSPGSAADFMAIDAASVREAVAFAPATRLTWKAGRLTASSSQSVELASVGSRSPSGQGRARP